MARTKKEIMAEELLALKIGTEVFRNIATTPDEKRMLKKLDKKIQEKERKNHA